MFSWWQMQRNCFFSRDYNNPIIQDSVAPVSKSFVLSVRAIVAANPLAMQIKPCFSSKTFQSVPNSRSQDLPKFTASNLISQDLCQNLPLRVIPHTCLFFYENQFVHKFFTTQNFTKCTNFPLECTKYSIKIWIFRTLTVCDKYEVSFDLQMWVW